MEKIYILNVIDIQEGVLTQEIECFEDKTLALKNLDIEEKRFLKDWEDLIDEHRCVIEKEENSLTIYENGKSSQNATYVTLYEKKCN